MRTFTGKRVFAVLFGMIAVAFIGLTVVNMQGPNPEDILPQLARIEVGKEPLGIAVTRDNRVIIASAAGRSLHVIDANTLLETQRLDLSAHGRLSRVFVSPQSEEIFVSASVKGEVLKLDADLSSVSALTITGGFPQGMALVDGKLLVALTSGNAVAVLDPKKMVSLLRLDAGDRPSSVHVDRNNGKVYVVKSTTRSVWVYSALDFEWLKAISDPSLVRLSDMAQGPNGELLLLDGTQDVLLVMPPSGDTIEKRIPLLPDNCEQCTHVPMALAVSPDGSRIAVAGRGGWVSLIDLKKAQLIGAQQVGKDLRGIVWAGDNRIFTTSFATSEVVVLDGR